MAILSKEQILAADDLKKEEIEVPAWGGSVFIRTMTGEERDRFESESLETRGNDRVVNLKNFRARLLVLCVCDSTGKRLFTDAELAALGQKSAAALDKLYDVAQRLNGIGKKETEELTKN